MKTEVSRNLKEKVWLMFENKAVQGIIDSIRYSKFEDCVTYDKIIERTCYTIVYMGKEIGEYECTNLFDTRDDLINSL